MEYYLRKSFLGELRKEIAKDIPWVIPREVTGGISEIISVDTRRCLEENPGGIIGKIFEVLRELQKNILKK